MFHKVNYNKNEEINGRYYSNFILLFTDYFIKIKYLYEVLNILKNHYTIMDEIIPLLKKYLHGGELYALYHVSKDTRKFLSLKYIIQFIA